MSRLSCLLICLLVAASIVPHVLAQGTTVGEDIRKKITDIAMACYLVIIPLILLGLALGYVQIAGPWGLQTVKKSGRGQIEIGVITLVVFLITPVLVVMITNIATAISGGCTWEKLLSEGKC